MRGRRFAVGLVVAVVVLTLAVGVAAADPVDLDPEDLAGEGTVDDPYIITNASELQAMGGNLSAHYKLGSDIDASDTEDWNGGNGFEPIGSSTLGDQFAGTFNGSEFTISNLSITRSSESQVGLFAMTVDGAIVEKVGLEDVDIHGNGNVGGLIGLNRGTVNESYATGAVTGGNNRVGGLVGQSTSESKVSESYATGDVDGNRGVGGLVGDNSGKVNESYATGNVDGSSGVGGLVGRNFAGAENITHAYWDDQAATITESGNEVFNQSDGGHALRTVEMTGEYAEDNMFEFGST